MALVHESGRPFPCDFRSTGRDAEVEASRTGGSALSGVSGLRAVHTVHKSVLTAWLAPKRSTLLIQLETGR